MSNFYERINNQNFNLKVEIKNIQKSVKTGKYYFKLYITHFGTKQKIIVITDISAKTPADLKKEIAKRIIQAIKEKGIKQYYR